jgi:hypothetical protein
MSQRQAGALQNMRERITIIVLALLTPLIISFILYIVASAFGAASLPPVGYGIVPACPNNTTNVAYIWEHTAACADTAAQLSTDPSLPIPIMNAFNAFLIFIAIVVAIITAVRLVGSLMEASGE